MAAKPLLIPRSVRHPITVLAVCVLPQLVLLTVNYSAWQLCVAEAQDEQRHFAWLIFGMQMLSLFAGAGLSGWLLATKRLLSRWEGLIPLFASLAFLATVFLFANRAIPFAVADWMLPRDQWMLKQFALAMPAALFGAMRFLCPDEDDEQNFSLLDRAVIVCLLAFGVGIASLFVIAPILNAVPHFVQESEWFQLVPFVMCFAFMTIFTVAAASLLRVGISAYLRARRSGPAALAALTFCVALAGPVLGLMLNVVIPFPADFQSRAIYTAAVVNGLVLMLPDFSQPAVRRLVWMAQCVTFPFTVYFFAVFLPFLLLAPFAMMLGGLGVLIYVPSLLFFLHGCRLLDGYRAEVRGGSRWKPAAMGIAAVLIWPAAYTLQARWDRASLHRALDYLQYPNYTENARFGGSLFALRSSLENLRDFKEGLYLPFLSEYYNWLAFDGMVLPQSRLNDLSETFLGQSIGKSTRRPTFSEFGLGSRGARNVTEAVSGVQGLRPSANARLETVQTSLHREEGISRGLAKLIVRNPTSEATEFRTTFRVPPGVMISGLWLTIAGERVPGRIFEKRAAMWVYQKITERRPIPQDPAILRYTGPETVSLQVYPVEGSGTRTVEVEFLFADGTNPAIALDGHGALDFAPNPAAEPAVGVTSAGEFLVTVPASPGLPQVTREPYLHVLVDTSAASDYANATTLRNSLRGLASRFPEVSQAKLTFVNFETRDAFGGRPVPVPQLLEATDDELTSPVQGGFLASRAIKEVLWKHQVSLNAGNEEALRGFPQIVVLRGSERAARPEETSRLEEFFRLAPDVPGYWNFARPGAAGPSFVPFVPADLRSDIRPVHIFQVGGMRFAAPAGQPAAWVSATPASSPPDQLEAFDPKAGRFIFVGKLTRPANAAYAQAISPWSLEMRRLFEPWRQRKEALGALLELCRSSGILVPSVAYMVVENSAQWKMLERAEKKAMKGHEALAMQESVPEPNTLLLVITGAAALLASRRRR